MRWQIQPVRANDPSAVPGLPASVEQGESITSGEGEVAAKAEQVRRADRSLALTGSGKRVIWFEE